MQYSLDIPVNMIEVVFSILTWAFIIFMVYYFYKRQEVKPKLWKAFVATFIGLFTFSLNFALFDTVIKVPILPLGVWILLWYASKRAGAWIKYRRFAWLGFSANIIFIAATFLSILLHHTVYPKSNLSTYIANYEDAAIIQLHPSASDVVFDKESFKQLFSSFEEYPVIGIEWYNDIFLADPHEKKEKFPYLLTGTSSKWGSGIPTMVYVEIDGKGILIDSSERQRYFRTSDSFLKGGNGG